MFLVRSPLRRRGNSCRCQAVDPSSSGSDEDSQIPPCVGLPNEAQVSLSGSPGEGARGENLFDFLHRDVVAGDVIVTARFEEKRRELRVDKRRKLTRSVNPEVWNSVEVA